MLKVLVIGLGKIAIGYDLQADEPEVHGHCRAYLRNPGIELVGGVDPVASQRALFETLCSRPAWPTIEDFATGVETSIDLISVCTPTADRLNVVREILERISPAAILLEKPIARTWHEAQTIKQLVDEADTRVFVNYFRNFLPEVRRLLDELTAGRFGALQSVGVVYSNGLWNNAAHFIHLLSELFVQEPEVAWVGKSREALAGADVDVDFVLNWGISVSFRAADESRFSLGELDIICDAGRVCITDFGFSCRTFLVEEDPRFQGTKRLSEAEVRQLLRPSYMEDAITEVCRRCESGENDSFDRAMSTVSICSKIEEHLHGL